MAAERVWPVACLGWGSASGSEPLDAGVIDRKHRHHGVRPRQPTGVRWRVVVRDIENAHQGLRDADEAGVIRFQSAWVLFRSEK